MSSNAKSSIPDRIKALFIGATTASEPLNDEYKLLQKKLYHPGELKTCVQSIIESLPVDGAEANVTHLRLMYMLRAFDNPAIMLDDLMYMDEIVSQGQDKRKLKTKMSGITISLLGLVGIGALSWLFSYLSSIVNG